MEKPFSWVLAWCTLPVLCEGGGVRGEWPESNWAETPRPRERFTDTVAEPQGPKD